MTVGILMISIISTRAAVLPVIDIQETTDSFTPSGDENWDYYVLEPGTSHSSVKYMGKSGTASYTDTGSSSFSTRSTSVTKDSFVTSGITSGDLRSGDHPLFDPEPYPRAVRIESKNDPSFTRVQKDPINLHMDHSFTFRAEKNAEYFGLISSSDPFFLDIEISDCNANGYIYFGSAMPSNYYIATNKKMTYPVFPIGGVSIQNFTFSLDNSAIVTLTPHNLPVSEKLIATLEVNTTFSGEIEQGGMYYVDQKTGDMYLPEADFFSLRLFNISVQQGEYYKVFLDIAGSNLYGSCPNIHSFLWGEDYITIPGSSLDQNGLLINAIETEELLLVLYSPGEAHLRYTVTFQNVSPPPPAEVESLTLNEDTEIFEDKYYVFTLTAPHMMAVNWTSSYGFDFCTPNTVTGDWNTETNDNWFSPETGFLYGFSVNDIGTNWRYLPAGTYAVMPWSVPFGGEIRFTTVPIQQVSPSLQLSVNQDSLFALELPSTLSHHSHSINMSTTDHKNESIRYEWGLVGKYKEIVITTTNNRWFGNQLSGNSWTAWAYNNSEIRTYRPWLKYYAPILMLRPFEAENITSAIDTFTASLIVTVTSSQSHGYDTGYIAGSAITGSTSLTVNDDHYVGDFPVYVIPMTLDPYGIYNITSSLIGNYTTGGAKNATFTTYSIMGGNLGYVSIFDGILSGSNTTKSWKTALILTVSSTTYLYAYINRAFSGGEYLNSTWEISIEKLPTTLMDFDVQDWSEYNWNETVHEKEVSNEDLLATQIEASELESSAPGFEIAFALGTLVILTGIYAKNRRKN